MHPPTDPNHHHLRTGPREERRETRRNASSPTGKWERDKLARKGTEKKAQQPHFPRLLKKIPVSFLPKFPSPQSPNHRHHIIPSPRQKEKKQPECPSKLPNPKIKTHPERKKQEKRQNQTPISSTPKNKSPCRSSPSHPIHPVRPSVRPKEKKKETKIK